MQGYDKRLYFSLKPMKVATTSFLLLILIASSALSREKSKDTTDYNLPQPVTYIEFLARSYNMVGICYEPLLHYDSTALFGAGIRVGLQIGIGTTLPLPLAGVRFDVPVVPVLVIGKEYGVEIGAGLDLQWWLSKGGFQDGEGGSTYNSVKLTGIIGYRDYNYGAPHHLLRIGCAPTLQADGHVLLSLYVSGGI